jgi:hypothetical protein
MCAELSGILIKKKTLNTQGLQTCGLRVDIFSIQLLNQTSIRFAVVLIYKYTK